MNQQHQPEHTARTLVQRLRVPAGFGAGIGFLAFARPTWVALGAGVPIALLGAAIRAWASGHLRKNADLATGGPYAFTRNPLYLGSLVMALGCAVCGGILWLGALLLALFLLIYVPVIRTEALHMRKLFGAQYEGWAAEVPLLWPRVTPFQGGLTQGFDSGQYLRHREYRAAAGLVLVIGFLSLRAAGVLEW
jgi:protein-S-isoprenylcysteine O-methyltransferase Ste14